MAKFLQNKPIVFVICGTLVFFLIAAVYFYERTVSLMFSARKAFKDDLVASSSAIAHIASSLVEGDITHVFRQNWITLSESHKLEVAVFENEVEITKLDALHLIKIPLGTTITTLKFPATFRYQVDLNKKWIIEKKSNICYVVAPEIESVLPVGFDTSKMEVFTKQGWARFNGEEQIEEARKDISRQLTIRANGNKNIVLDKARLSIADFVRNWLLRENEWQENKVEAIAVTFENEIKRTEDNHVTLKLK